MEGSRSNAGAFFIAKLIEALDTFDLLVYEDCDEQGRPAWLHVSYKRKGENRKEVQKKMAKK